MFAWLFAAMVTPVTAGARVRTGADILVDSHFAQLAGKRVGLITNPTGVSRGRHLIDYLADAPSVRLVALFAPEHGLRGKLAAGAEVRDGHDRRTGLPVHSLYGKTRQPTPAMLRGIDVLVFDIQDIGTRFYTYISTMGLAMQAAARTGVSFMVLDRPNPLGGTLVSGYIMEPAHVSFVGQFAIPIVHGMTAGELARMIKGHGLLAGLDHLDLNVVTMTGWRRDMQWPDTGLAFAPPSPNIPDFTTALVYPGTALFEATRASEGRGTHRPFLQIGALKVNGKRLAGRLNRAGLPGVTFSAVRFTPRPIASMAPRPKLKGRRLGGVRINVVDPRAYRPVVTGVYVLKAFYDVAGRTRLISRRGWLAKLSGSNRLFRALQSGRSARAIAGDWADDVVRFKRERAPYLLY